MITSFKIFENISRKPVKVGKYLFHRSSIENRESIRQDGLFPKTGDRRLGVDKYKEDAIFATNSDKKSDWFDSTYDDDCWRIDTAKIPDAIWYVDFNMGTQIEHPHVMTTHSIPPDALDLIYEGTGRDTLFESSKTEVQSEVDRLMDKGLKNLTPEELEYLKNPYKQKEEPEETDNLEILKYYTIAEDFFRKVIGRDIRNFELNDDLDLWDIMSTEEEVYHVGNIIYYKYGVQIDSENNDDFKLVNIFKKISQRIQK